MVLKPATFKVGQGSTMDLVFKESMATKFLPGADKLLPQKRVEAFNREWSSPNHGIFAKYIAYGKMIDEQLPSNDLDNQAIDLISKINATPEGLYYLLS